MEGAPSPNPEESVEPNIVLSPEAAKQWLKEPTIEEEVKFAGQKVEEYVEQVKQESEVDYLTGVANRRGFDKWVKPRVEGVERSRLGKTKRKGDPETMHVASADADDFKLVNDGPGGHDAGDKVLTWLAGQMEAKFRGRDDIVARFGGEEFVIVLTGTDTETATRLINELREQIETNSKPMLEGWGISGRDALTVSLGVAEFDKDCSSIDDAIKHADTAMYAAKHGGKNRVALYTPDMQGKPEAA